MIDYLESIPPFDTEGTREDIESDVSNMDKREQEKGKGGPKGRQHKDEDVDELGDRPPQDMKDDEYDGDGICSHVCQGGL